MISRTDSRGMPLTIIDSDRGMAEEAQRHDQDEANEGPRSLGRSAPCFLHVGEVPIDEGRIAQEMQHHPDADPKHSRRAAAEALVVRELLRLECERLGLDSAAEAVAGETAEEAAIRLLIDQEIPVPPYDPQAARRWFEQNTAQLREPDRIRLRHILLAAPADDIDERLKARTQGESLIAELQQYPERFSDFAMRHSVCPSRDQGGDLGWIEHGSTTPEFERQVFMLPKGLARLTVETRYGHHVVHVDEIARGAPLGFEQAEQRIRTYLEIQSRQNAIQQYLELLAERYGVHGLEHFDKQDC